jgi:putative aminopeptidase FrvX
MTRLSALNFALLLLAWSSLADTNNSVAVDLAEVRRVATNAQSLFLGPDERIHAAETFLQLVQIKGPSGQEQLIREELRRRLRPIGAVEISAKAGAANAPLNLVMEIVATGALSNQPGILLNAHMDTIASSNPERLAFDPASGDFYHLDDGVPGKSSSFGGDDRSSVAVIVEAFRVLHEQFWSKGVAHRRIVLLFTADEERGCVGAKYLSRERPEVFAGLAISLAMDGPIELRSNYPTDSYVLVVAKTNEVVQPYQRVLRLVENFCARTRTSFGRTETGLSSGDFAYFPPVAKAGLHIRSPVRGWHSRERVKVKDLIGHTELMCFLLLGWDHSLPEKIAPDALKNPPSRALGR